MDTVISQMREEAVADLKDAIAELEAGEELTRFVVGSGFQSRRFVFQWDDERLSIDLRLPYAWVLADEEAQLLDVMELGVAMRMAILLLSVPEEGGGGRIAVVGDEDGVNYAVFDASGVMTDAGEDWDALAARLENAFPAKGESFTVIWP